VTPDNEKRALGETRFPTAGVTPLDADLSTASEEVVQSDDARCLRRLGFRLLLLAEAVEELEDGPKVAA
jgi:hypothetical protein